MPVHLSRISVTVARMRSKSWAPLPLAAVRWWGVALQNPDTKAAAVIQSPDKQAAMQTPETRAAATAVLRLNVRAAATKESPKTKAEEVIQSPDAQATADMRSPDIRAAAAAREVGGIPSAVGRRTRTRVEGAKDKDTPPTAGLIPGTRRPEPRWSRAAAGRCSWCDPPPPGMISLTGGLGLLGCWPDMGFKMKVILLKLFLIFLQKSRVRTTRKNNCLENTYLLAVCSDAQGHS